MKTTAPHSAAPPIPRPSQRRMGLVQDPIIPIVADLIRRHPGTLSLGQGVVSYGPPPQAMESLQQGMSDPENHKYRPVQGLPVLIDTFWDKVRSENGWTRDAQRAVLVTAGSNMGFMQAILAIADPGDEIIIQSPYYFNHEMALHLASAKPVIVPTNDSFQLDLVAIQKAITPRTRAIVTISPNNPTGVVYDRADLEAVNALCRQAGLFHIHDEAYEYFHHDGSEPFSPGSIEGSQPHTISLFSLSKGYGFASWRIGFLVVPAALEHALLKVQDTLLICAPVISQWAAVGAMRCGREWVMRQIQPIRQSRELFKAELSTLGDRCVISPSRGAFYFWLKLRSEMHPMECVRRLVEEFRVAAVPGTAFGMEGCNLRVSYGALTPETAREGIRRLAEGIRSMVK